MVLIFLPFLLTSLWTWNGYHQIEQVDQQVVQSVRAAALAGASDQSQTVQYNAQGEGAISYVINQATAAQGVDQTFDQNPLRVPGLTTTPPVVSFPNATTVQVTEDATYRIPDVYEALATFYGVTNQQGVLPIRVTEEASIKPSS